MNILGMDIGNFIVNSSTGVNFEATITSGHTLMNKEDIKATYNNSDWTLGSSDGAKNIGRNKYKKIHFKLCLLVGIAKSVNQSKNNINAKVCLGVPVEQFNDKVLIAEIKKEVLSWGREKIYVNNIEKNIQIHDVEVFTESGIVFSNKEKYKNEKTLVIDLGGSTVDISGWDGLRLTTYKTYKEGLISLYEKIISKVNLKEGTLLNSYAAKDMIGKSSYSLKQEIKNIEYINDDVENYILALTSYINQYFDIDLYNSIQLIGGGAVVLEKWLKGEYDKAVLVPKASFANANLNKIIGDMIWI